MKNHKHPELTGLSGNEYQRAYLEKRKKLNPEIYSRRKLNAEQKAKRTHKVCCRCFVDKPLTEFYKYGDAEYGRCKECHKKIAYDWTRRNMHKQSEYTARWKDKLPAYKRRKYKERENAYAMKRWNDIKQNHPKKYQQLLARQRAYYARRKSDPNWSQNKRKYNRLYWHKRNKKEKDV